MHVPTESLERYIIGQVSEEDALEIDEHLSACPDCQDLLLHTNGFQSIGRVIVTEAE
jgi:hypothetical protein